MIRAVIRLRSSIKANHEVVETLQYLRLNKVNHCVLIPDNNVYNGMLQKVKDYVTWGEIKPDVLTNMLIKRGRLSGDISITNQYIKENTKYESLVKFAEAITSGSYKFSDLKDVKPVFRLHPPRQGLEGIKRSFRDRGSLGYRGEAINILLLKMLDAPVKKKPETKVSVKPVAEKVAAPAKKVAMPKSDEPAPKKAPAKKTAAPKAAEPVKKKAAPKKKEGDQ